MRCGTMRLIAVVATMVAVTSQGKANFVIDGGFESGAFTPNWSQSGNTGSTAVATGQYAKTGNFGAALAPVGSSGFLAQQLSLTTGLTYTLSYDLGVFALGNPTPINSFSVSIGTGGTLTSLTLTNAPVAPYAHFSTNFTLAGPGSASLQFAFRNDPGSFGLDNVDVSLASASVATPLPPTLLAGFVGMALLAGVRRLRRT